MMNQDRMRLLIQTKVQNDAFRKIYGFGEQEALLYIEGLLCPDKVTYFAKLRSFARAEFPPWESDAFLKDCPSVWHLVNQPSSRCWWRYVEDYSPKAGIVPHRYLFDPFANVWDVAKASAAFMDAGWGKQQQLLALCQDENWHPYANNTETGYINFQFEKVNSTYKKNITRSRLIAYRFPHLVWHDYMRERYGLENFLAAPFEVLLHMMGLDFDGNMIPTGFYHCWLNDVEERSTSNGKIRTHQPKGPSGAGRDWPCSVFEIDHINRDHTDDRPTNLRITDRLMNLLNSGNYGFRNYGYHLRSNYLASLQNVRLPAVKIVP
ncbi:TPA: hypothetical protein OB598_004467 [Escherichia coli]|nr:hypothetical protein [Escherichia coli]